MSATASAAGQPYQYVVLRCVPRVDREEFLNVGVIVYSQSAGVLAMAHHLDAARLGAAFPELDLGCAADVLDHLAQVVSEADAGDGPDGARGRGRTFGWLSAPKSTVIQPGPLHGGVAAEARAEAEALARRLVPGFPGDG